MIRVSALVVAIAFTVLPLLPPARAAEDKQPAIVIAVRPAHEPVPALKYGLLPERGKLVLGNAAVFYHRAIAMYLEASQRTRRNKELGKSTAADEQAVGDWISVPLHSIPRDQARQWLGIFPSVLHEAELGAYRRTCDWEFESRKEGVWLLIPEIQNSRFLGRLVGLRARMAVLEGKYDDAVHWIQVGFAIARHVSQGPSLIQSLVGISVASIMTKPLEDLIQSPGMSSLYWALADRPRPFIDLTLAYSGERYLLEQEIPQLLELDAPPWSGEKARAFSEELRHKLFKLAGWAVRSPFGSGSPDLDDWSQQVRLAALVAQVYPEAKRVLIAHGRPASQVEAMPVVQAAALHAFQSYQQSRDDLFKWTSLSYYQAYKGMDNWSIAHQSQANMTPLSRLFTMLIPSVASVHIAQLRVDRNLDAIHCIEAIRIYAAAHGKLPPRLDEIAEAPVPLDAATGKLFDYQVEGDVAVLSGSYPPGSRAPHIPQYTVRYELKLSH
jgi:hypothetical protein